MQLELQTNEKQLKQLQKEWDSERTSLRGELANVKEALVDVQMEQAGDRAKLKEAMIKVNIPTFITSFSLYISNGNISYKLATTIVASRLSDDLETSSRIIKTILLVKL